TVVNTHSDGDHWWGNELVSGAEIVTSGKSARQMARERPQALSAFRAIGSGLGLAGSLPVGRAARLRAAGDYFRAMLAPYDWRGLRLTPATRTFDGRLELEV